MAGGIFSRLGDDGETQMPQTISDDLNRQDLGNRPSNPGELAYGPTLFAREAG